MHRIYKRGSNYNCGWMKKLLIILVLMIVLASGCTGRPRPTGIMELNLTSDLDSIEDFSNLVIGVERVDLLKASGKKASMSSGMDRFDLKGVLNRPVVSGEIPAEDYIGLEIVFNAAYGLSKENSSMVIFKSKNVTVIQDFSVKPDSANSFKVTLSVEKVADHDYELIATRVEMDQRA